MKIIALKTSTKKNDEPKEEVAESSDNENLNLQIKRFEESILRGKATKVIKIGTIMSEMIQVILLVSLIIIVENKDISKLSLQTLTKRRKRVVTLKRRKRLRKDVAT